MRSKWYVPSWVVHEISPMAKCFGDSAKVPTCAFQKSFSCHLQGLLDPILSAKFNKLASRTVTGCRISMIYHGLMTFASYTVLLRSEWRSVRSREYIYPHLYDDSNEGITVVGIRYFSTFHHTWFIRKSKAGNMRLECTLFPFPLSHCQQGERGDGWTLSFRASEGHTMWPVWRLWHVTWVEVDSRGKLCGSIGSDRN